MPVVTRRLEIGARARSDLKEIWIYTDERWGADQAERYSDELDAAMAGLASGGRIGHAAAVVGYHTLRVRSHMIYYRVRPSVIRVVRILHGRRDAERHLTR